MIGAASGSSSAAAVLNPVNPSIATTSIPFCHCCGRAASHRLKTALERPSTMSSSRAGPVFSRTGVRSMITVTYLSPRFVWRHTCSSTPIVVTPSKRWGSSISCRVPSARIASFAADHDTASPAATREMDRWSTTSPSSPHRRPPREIFARGGAAAVVSWRHTRPHPEHL
ncbi:hypothetical protein Si084_01842 [Streptococcus infantarius subsp. infantarius]|nr:hypothetical protein [Streptococcus infantarius subsp. infantarius]